MVQQAGVCTAHTGVSPVSSSTAPRRAWRRSPSGAQAGMEPRLSADAKGPPHTNPSLWWLPHSGQLFTGGGAVWTLHVSNTHGWSSPVPPCHMGVLHRAAQHSLRLGPSHQRADWRVRH